MSLCGVGQSSAATRGPADLAAVVAVAAQILKRQDQLVYQVVRKLVRDSGERGGWLTLDPSRQGADSYTGAPTRANVCW